MYEGKIVERKAWVLCSCICIYEERNVVLYLYIVYILKSFHNIFSSLSLSLYIYIYILHLSHAHYTHYTLHFPSPSLFIYTHTIIFSIYEIQIERPHFIFSFSRSSRYSLLNSQGMGLLNSNSVIEGNGT